MFFRAIVFSLLLLLSSFGASTSGFTHTTAQSTSNSSYTYERVLIDGTWWIIVYDEDGSVIVILPDE